MSVYLIYTAWSNSYKYNHSLPVGSLSGEVDEWLARRSVKGSVVFFGEIWVRILPKGNQFVTGENDLRGNGITVLVGQ